MRTRLVAMIAGLALAVGVGALFAQPASAAGVAPARTGSSSYVKGRTDITVDPGTAAALTSLGVKVQPFLATNRSRAGKVVFGFPIVGNPADGTIEHVGGLVLYTRGGKYIVLSNYTIDLNRGAVSGKVNFRTRVDLFTIGAATADGVTLKLTAGAASALNSTFGVTAFTPGLTFGYGNPRLR